MVSFGDLARKKGIEPSNIQPKSKTAEEAPKKRRLNRPWFRGEDDTPDVAVTALATSQVSPEPSKTILPKVPAAMTPTRTSNPQAKKSPQEIEQAWLRTRDLLLRKKENHAG